MTGDGKDDWNDTYARITGRTIDEEIEAIDGEARWRVAELNLGVTSAKRNELARWLVMQLGHMSVYRRPPPPKLVELTAHLLKVGSPPRNRRRNQKKFREAARHVARHPNATPSAIARAIGYDQKNQIKTWLEDPEFHRVVKHESSRIQKLHEG